MFQQRPDGIRSVWKASPWLPCSALTGTGRGRRQRQNTLGGERVPVTPTQRWCLPPPGLSPRTSGYRMSVVATSLSNVVSWAYGGALRSFSGFKSTLGRLNIVVTNPSGLRPPNHNPTTSCCTRLLSGRALLSSLRPQLQSA